MDSLLIFVHFLSLAAWSGAQIFLFMVATPALYGMLSDDLARRVCEQLLRGYYTLATACGVTALASLVAVTGMRGELGWFWWRASLLLIMTLLTGAAAWSIQPRIDSLVHSIEDRDLHGGPEVRRLLLLQRMALQLNGSVLLLGLTTLWLSMGGPGT